MTQLKSNTLSVSAETVRELLAESDALATKSIDKALEAGRLLVIAKEECRHGEWLPFLERAGIGERKAQRYMTLARSGMKSDTVTLLGGIRAALEFLSRPKLPTQGECLEITAKAGDRITAVGVVWPSVDHSGFYYCAVLQHPADPEGDASAPVIWTKRPVSGEPIDLGGGRLYEPVWAFFKLHMGAPSSMWKYDNDGVLAEILAGTLDLPYLIRESENQKRWRDVDSQYAADLLESAGLVPAYPADRRLTTSY